MGLTKKQQKRFEELCFNDDKSVRKDLSQKEFFERLELGSKFILPSKEGLEELGFTVFKGKNGIGGFKPYGVFVGKKKFNKKVIMYNLSTKE